MTNNFSCNKRYYTLDSYLKSTFGCKVAKISLNAGFSCPNRDGTKSYNGCIYCSPMASGDFAGDKNKDIVSQFSDIKAVIDKKWKNAKYIPYFQAGTNTYAPLPVLKKMYETALSLPDIVGLSIATRPDCISDDTLEYLHEISNRTYLTVELGLQTIHDKTGKLINRQTDFSDFCKCYEKLKSRNINICVHLINGLPGENYEMMIESVKAISEMHPHSIKLHMLHILKNTEAEKMYLNGKIKLFEPFEYINLICDQLEYIRPDIVIQRITGDGSRDTLVAPLWSIKKFNVLNGVDKELKRRDSYQGIKCAF